ncbi:MAG: hypothetical protein Q4G68_05805 [Planctomycetia bacterium]|nr:hypothetical protein [Planctomycetia bacterium]
MLMLAVLLLLVPTCAFGQSLATHKIRLANGETITGAMTPAELGTASEYKIAFADGTEVTLPAGQIRAADPLGENLLKYREKAPLAEDSVAAHLAVAKWCRDNGLSGYADKHYARILELDPENDEVHQLLGHIKEDGNWISPKERQAQLGLVRFAGRNMSEQEAALEKMRRANKEELSQLRKEFKAALTELHAGGPAGRNYFRNLRNPLAQVLLSESFNNEPNPDLRIVYVQAMGSLATPASLMELGVIAMKDDNLEVRLLALDMIQKKRLAVPDAIVWFSSFLHSNDNLQVNRAGAALGVLDAYTMIPELINALITDHKREIIVGSDQTSASFGGDGQLKGFSPGGTAKKKVITETFNNEEVLNALSRIVARHYTPVVDFRYDINAWRRWYQQQERSWEISPRRDK